MNQQDRATAVPILSEDGQLRPLVEIEDDILRLAISHQSGSVTKAARLLGIGRSTLYRRISGLCGGERRGMGRSDLRGGIE